MNEKITNLSMVSILIRTSEREGVLLKIPVCLIKEVLAEIKNVSYSKDYKGFLSDIIPSVVEPNILILTEDNLKAISAESLD
jgi:hypothetical protein